MPIIFKVDEVGVLSMSQIIEIQKFISERSKSIVHTTIDLTPQDGPIQCMEIHPYVDISGCPIPKVKGLPNSKSLKKKK